MSTPKVKPNKARELYEAGQLDGAIAELTRELKKNPTDDWARTFLFELLCFNGDWTRAEKILMALSLSSAHTEAGAQAYFNNIKAEMARERFFKSGSRPCFLIEPPGYISHYLEANDHLRNRELAAALTLLDRGEQQRRTISGEVNGKKFQDFRDSNDFTAPVLELYVGDNYYWLPFEQISRITVERPKQLRNLLWARARVDTINGPLGDVFLPVLYASSCEHEKSMVRLGRVTQWQPLGSEIYLPAGQRLFLAGSDEITLLEVKELTFAATSCRKAMKQK